MNEIREKLFSLQDEKYKVFQCKLMPTVNPEKVIGVRTPHLRKLSKELYKEGKAEEFMKNLPHDYYEEDNLHATFIEKIKDFDECVNELDRFLPFVDNWATCDMMNPKALKKNPEKLREKAFEWMKSKDTYTVRYGIGVFMRHFLKEDFEVEYAEKIAEIRSEEYYINMMVAWYFATALAFQYEAILPFFEEQKLPTWTHRKAIQKAKESYRITAEQKSYLNENFRI
jgi:3-methyladenine DNA glycosylase AlkD